MRRSPDDASVLHELRTRAFDLANDGRFVEAFETFLVAADHARAVGLPTEVRVLVIHAEQVLVVMWAARECLRVRLEDIVRLRGRRRYGVVLPNGERLVVRLNRADQVRVAKRREGGQG